MVATVGVAALLLVSPLHQTLLLPSLFFFLFFMETQHHVVVMPLCAASVLGPLVVSVTFQPPKNMQNVVEIS